MISFKNIKLKLAQKIIIFLILLIFSLIGPYTFFQIRSIEKTLLDDAEKNHILLFSNSLAVFSKTLWDFDKDICAKAVSALFEDGTVKRIQIFNLRGELFYGMQYEENNEGKYVLKTIHYENANYSKLNIGNPDTPKQPFNDSPLKLISPIQNFPQHEHRLVASLWWREPITAPAKFIGTVEMDFSTAYIESRVSERKISFVYLTIILILTIFSLTFIFLKYYVISPIRKLMQASLDVSSGRFTRLKPLKSQDEIGSLTDNFNFMVNKIEQNLQLEKDRAHMERDLELAKAVQNTLLSRSFPKSKYYDLFSLYRPASQCGGDWYGIYELTKNKILILLGDVSGHGTPAALITAVICGAAEMQMQFINNDILIYNENFPAKILESINKCILQVCKEQYLMTMVAVMFDIEAEKITISSAGHNPPALIYQENENTLTKFIYPPIGYRLGFKNHVEYEAQTFDFKPSQQLVLYTDGIVEGENSLGKEYGNKNFRNSLRTHANNAPESFLKNVSDDAFRYCENVTQKDDITILLLRFLKN